MNLKKRHPLDEAAASSGIPTEIILQFISYEWIQPVDREHLVLDEEDIARSKLIWQLKHDLGVNDESIPIILHLIDQLNRIHFELKHQD